MPELIPVRMGRMLQSPFAFFRGAALLMATDLVGTPDIGLQLQVCGDAHLANFGLFESPERHLLFDVNDFDETTSAPWEWDLKRLCTSAVLAGREGGCSPTQTSRAARSAARAYRDHVRTYSSMGDLDIWYSHVDAAQVRRSVRTPRVREQVETAPQHTARAALPSLTALAPDGSRRIVDHPPLVSHQGVDHELLHAILHGYRASLTDEQRALVDRFEVVDFARKVVGVGSVGTRCFMALLMSGGGDPLMLQVKEEQRSALDVARRVRRAGVGAGAKRVVDGQRRMQAATDIFLGWSVADGTSFSVRQLRDGKGTIDPLSLGPAGLAQYGSLCGWALARAHVRGAGAEHAACIAGYLGSGPAFDEAVTRFATAYADQTELDYGALAAASAAGRFAAAGAS
ncbi:MAG: DUF2252 domain-containing protein [Acidimicrobiales bacterium]